MSGALDSFAQAARAAGALLERALGPLDSADPDAGLKALIADLGYALPGSVPPAITGLRAQFATLAHAIDELETAIGGAAGDAAIAAAGVKAAAALLSVVEALSGLPGALDAQLPPAFEAATDFKDQFASRLLQTLVADALRARAPLTARVLRLIGLLEVTPLGADAAKFQTDFSRRALHLERLGTLLSDPVQLFRDVYGWGSSSIDLGLLHEVLQSLSIALGFPGRFDYPSPGLLHTIAPSVADPAMAQRIFEFVLFDVGIASVVAAVTAIPKANPAEKQGVAVTVSATGSLDGLVIPFRPDLQLMLASSLDLSAGVALLLRPGQSPALIADFDGPAQAVTQGSLNATLSYLRLPGADPLRIISFPGGSRLEADEIHLAGGIGRTKAGALDPQVAAGVKQGRLVISLAGADGFLSTLLPKDGISLEFDLSVGWSQALGVSIEGNVGLDLSMPLHLDIGPVSLQQLYLKLAIGGGGALALETSVGARGSLGPLAAAIDRVGLNTRLTFPSGGGNLGPANVDLSFKPPNGVGLSLDAGIVKGGGYLYIDADRGEYAGTLELVFAEFLGLHAIGIINTKMPDGSSGFSLLIIISADFGPGIQLGFGFTLLAVGGLVGLNRSMALQPLMDAVRTGAVDSILFPHDVVANAQKIISDLKLLFPPTPDKFLIGPMAKLGWGEPTLISLALGVIIEIPGNIAIIGVLKVALPADEIALIVLQVNFAGVLEFDKQRLYFFASLFDSHVLFITIEGEIGVLFGYGDDANFVLSVGGFHPKFNPPPLPFPTPRRIEVNIINEPFARIRCEGYFAVTTNTLQFGSLSEYFFGFSALSVEGHSSFDALIQFSPFHFTVSISTSFSIKVFGLGVYGIGIDLLLEGPAPWHVRGSGSLSFLFFSVDIPIEFTWGDSRDTTLPPVAAMPLVADEFGKRSNWRALLPKGSHSLVSLRQLDPDEAALVLHPVGTLHVSQRAIPLDLVLDKIGSQKPSDANRFTLTPGPGALAKVQDVFEQFAPAQFRDADDAAKLSEPAYAPQHGGIELSAGSAALASGTAITRTVRYDLTIIDTKLLRFRLRFYVLARGLYFHLMRGGSIALNPLSAARQAQLHPFEQVVTVSPERFTVARQTDNRAMDATVEFMSQAAANDHMARLHNENPSLTGTLHVLPVFEVAA